MIKHIVLFKLKDEALGASKQENLKTFKSMLEALPGKISEIIDYEVGLNFIENNPTHDLALYSSFKSIDDLIVYRDHPEHQKVVAFVKQVVDSRAVVDYED